MAVVRTGWLAWLPSATYPIRAGTHANSAFGLTFALEHARAIGDRTFADALEERARAWFTADQDYPARLEPGGDDFLSAALVEAGLMTAILGPGFGALVRSLPAVRAELVARAGDRLRSVRSEDGPSRRAEPRSRLVVATHCRRARRRPARRDAAAAAETHLDAALPHLFSGEYAGEHWVTTFALLALTD